MAPYRGRPVFNGFAAPGWLVVTAWLLRCDARKNGRDLLNECNPAYDSYQVSRPLPGGSKHLDRHSS